MGLGLLSDIKTAKLITQWCRKCNYNREQKKLQRTEKGGNELHKMGLGPEKEILEMDIKEWVKV